MAKANYQVGYKSSNGQPSNGIASFTNLRAARAYSRELRDAVQARSGGEVWLDKDGQLAQRWVSTPDYVGYTTV